MTSLEKPRTTAIYMDVRNSTPEHKKGEYRVFVEIEGQTLIIAYKNTHRAAQMHVNRISDQHVYGEIQSWGWEIKDKYNEGQW